VLALLRRERNHPALVEGVVDDLDFDLLDRHRILVDAEHTRRLAWRRAEPTGELREIVGGMQPLDRVAPSVGANQVIPFRNQVAQRTTVVAERNPAVHAPRRLVLQRRVREVFIDLVPVAQPQIHRAALGCFAVGVFQKTLWIRHWRPP
jgi:hypothetical protein